MGLSLLVGEIHARQVQLVLLDGRVNGNVGRALCCLAIKTAVKLPLQGKHT